MISALVIKHNSVIPAFLTKKPELRSDTDNAVSNEDISDIGRTLDGDEHAFSRLIRRYQGMITGIMWRFTRDITEVEELVQEVFIQAYSSLKSYRKKAPFSFWLKTIATRVGYRFWASRKKGRETDLEELWNIFEERKRERPSPEKVAEFVHALLAQLKPKDRLVMTLFYFEQCSMEEIAQRTGFTTGMVKMRTHRARKKLAALIEKEHMAEISEWIQNI